MTKPSIKKNDRAHKTRVRIVSGAMVASAAVAILVGACTSGGSNYDEPSHRGAEPRGSFTDEK